MKKSTLSIFAAILATTSSFSQAFITFNAPPDIGATTQVRAPNGTSSHTTMRGVFHITASEMTVSSPTSNINSFGFNLTNGVTGAPVTGSIIVYFQHTNDATNLKSTTFTTAITGMSTVYSNSMVIPVASTATFVDLALPSAFSYTGGNFYVAYDWICAGPFTASNTPATYAANNSIASPSGMTAASATTLAPATLGGTAFRPAFRFGSVNTVTNDIGVNFVTSPQVIATRVSTTHAVTAVIRNNSNATLNNIGVGLGVTGAVTHTAALIVPSLASGASTLVTFTPYSFASNLTGVANISVSVLSDQNNANNLASISQAINCNGQAAGPDITGSLFGNGIGFNTGSGILSNKMTFQSASTLTSVAVAISTPTSNLGNAMYAVVSNSVGTVLATSGTVTIGNGNLGTYTSFTMAAPLALNANEDYFIGVAQPSNSVGYFPVASFTNASNPVPPQTLFSQPIAGGTPAAQNSSLGFLGIKPMFQGTCTATSVGLTEVKNNIVNLSLYPNPAKDFLTVSIANADNANIDVINALGQVVLTVKNATETNTINTANLVKGVYFVTVSNGQQKSTQKLVIEK